MLQITGGGGGGQDRNCQGGKLSFRAVVAGGVRTSNHSFLVQLTLISHMPTQDHFFWIYVKFKKYHNWKVQVAVVTFGKIRIYVFLWGKLSEVWRISLFFPR